MLPSTAKGLDLRTGECGPPTLRQTWPAEVFSHQQAHRTDCIDQAARAKFSLLGQRCARILARFKEAKFEAAPVAGREAKPSGPNKRQRLLAATQGANAHTGHNWVVTSAAKNLCIKCTECSLYAQQVDPPEVVGFGKKGGQRSTPAPRVSSAQGFAALFAGRDVPALSSKALQIPSFRGPTLLFLLCLRLKFLSLGMAPKSLLLAPTALNFSGPSSSPACPSPKSKLELELRV